MKTSTTGKKRVLIVGINFSPELTGIGKYTGEMVDWLTEHKHECTVVTSYPYYPQWKHQDKESSGWWYRKEVSKQGRLSVYRCPMYVPTVPTGLKRIIHEATFFFSAMWVMLYLLFKPKHDTIFCMAPPFHLGYLGLMYRFFKGGKMVYHIHDMQIEAARDLEVIKSKSIFNLLFSMERFILESTNYVSTVSVGMRKKIASKTTKDVINFPNWVDTGKFWPLTEQEADKTFWGFDKHDKVVLYSGSIGEKQGLESLINIADDLKMHTSIKFVICGTGPYKDKLMQLAQQKNLKNFFFLPLQELEVFNRFLNMADVHLIVQKANASDLMMPSKLTTILAVGGLPLVTANPGTNLYEVINEYKMGVLVPAEDDEALKEGILKCCLEDFTSIRNNGRRYAEKYLERNSILKQVMSTIEEVSLVGSRMAISENKNS